MWNLFWTNVGLSTLKFKNRRRERGWRGTINMQRFLHFNYILNRVEDDRFALKFRGRARRVGTTLERGPRERKKKGVSGNWENRGESGRGSKFHGSLNFLEHRKTPLRATSPFSPLPSTRMVQVGDCLIGSSVLKRGESISFVSGMSLYKFSEFNFVRAVARRFREEKTMSLGGCGARRNVTRSCAAVLYIATTISLRACREHVILFRTFMKLAGGGRGEGEERSPEPPGFSFNTFSPLLDWRIYGDVYTVHLFHAIYSPPFLSHLTLAPMSATLKRTFQVFL